MSEEDLAMKLVYAFDVDTLAHGVARLLAASLSTVQDKKVSIYNGDSQFVL